MQLIKLAQLAEQGELSELLTKVAERRRIKEIVKLAYGQNRERPVGYLDRLAAPVRSAVSQNWMGNRGGQSQGSSYINQWLATDPSSTNAFSGVANTPSNLLGRRMAPNPSLLAQLTSMGAGAFGINTTPSVGLSDSVSPYLAGQGLANEASNKIYAQGKLQDQAQALHTAAMRNVNWGSLAEKHPGSEAIYADPAYRKELSDKIRNGIYNSLHLAQMAGVTMPGELGAHAQTLKPINKYINT